MLFSPPPPTSASLSCSSQVGFAMEKVQKSFHSFNDEAIKNPKGPCAQTIIKGGPVHHLQVEDWKARKEVTIGHFRPLCLQLKPIILKSLDSWSIFSLGARFSFVPHLEIWYEFLFPLFVLCTLYKIHIMELFTFFITWILDYASLVFLFCIHPNWNFHCK